MKLRNKKTGEIIETRKIIQNAFGAIIMLTLDEDERYPYEFHSLAELNEEWEDYKPQEPLIKDEKVRKAILLWAEANDKRVFEVQVDYQSYGDGSWSLRDTTREEDCGLSFIGKIPGDLNLGNRYTIAELCGEDEE